MSRYDVLIAGAAKHTLIGFSKVRAQALARGISEDEVVERGMLGPMSKKVFITEDEVAAAVEYLAGPLARDVTGQPITIDGGWTNG